MSSKNSSNSKPPRTEAQRQAARSNGAKSNGPVTPEGKQICALNSTRHGLRSEKTFVLDNESAEDFDEFRETIVQRFQPADKLELDLCLEMAHARWRLHRTWTIETAMMDNKMATQLETLQEKWTELDEATRLAEAWTTMGNGSPALSLLHRYESRLRRIFERALQNLEHLQRQRKKVPNEPEPAVVQPFLPMLSIPLPTKFLPISSEPMVSDEPDQPKVGQASWPVALE